MSQPSFDSCLNSIQTGTAHYAYLPYYRDITFTTNFEIVPPGSVAWGHTAMQNWLYVLCRYSCWALGKIRFVSVISIRSWVFSCNLVIVLWSQFFRNCCSLFYIEYLNKSLCANQYTPNFGKTDSFRISSVIFFLLRGQSITKYVDKKKWLGGR